MSKAEVVGSIHVDRKPRQKRTLKDEIDALDAKIKRAEQKVATWKAARTSLIEAAIAEGKAIMAEAQRVAAKSEPVI